MSKIIPVLFILLMLVPLVCEAERLGEKIMAGQSIEELRQSHQESQARKATLVNASPTSCLATSRSVLCVPGERGRVEFLPPFPAAVEPHLTAASNVQPDLEFSWAPEALVDQGRSILVPLLRSAELYQPLTCNGERCEVAVNVVEGPNSQALAICTAFRFGEPLGPPNQCEVVAVRNGPEWWIKVIDFAEYPPSRLMIPIYTLEVRGLPRSSILASLDIALSGSPLIMPDRSVKSDRVMASAPKRFSQVLSGRWFEWPQVLVELDEEYRVAVSLDLLVNKQNTDNPADWHLPTDQQQAEYRKEIVGVVTKALTPICVQPKWKGSDVLTCTKLRTMDGAIVEIPEGASGWEYSEQRLGPRVTRQR